MSGNFSHNIRYLLIGVVTGIVFVIVAIVAFLMYPPDQLFIRGDSKIESDYLIVDQDKTNNFPDILHLDVSESSVSKLAVGDIPLSYGYLFSHPESHYSRTVRELSRLAAGNGNMLVVNFSPSELPRYEIDMILGAACISEQNLDALYPYHMGIISGDGIPSREDLVERARETGVDFDVFLDCFNNRDLADNLVRDWNPDELSLDDFITITHADGKPQDDVLDYCSEYVEFDDIDDISACLSDLFEKIEEYGDFQSFLRHEQSGIDISLNEYSLSALRPFALSVKRDAERGQLEFNAISPDGSVKQLASITPFNYAKPQLWYGKGMLYVLLVDSMELHAISLVDRTINALTLPENLISKDDEQILSYQVQGDQSLFLVCSNDYIPEDCRLLMFDLTAGDTSTTTVDRELILYEGMWIDYWVPGDSVVIMRTGGGDGGVLYAGEFHVDLVNGEVETLNDFSHITLECSEQSDINEYCTSESVQDTKDYQAWSARNRREHFIRWGCNESLEEVVSESRGEVIGCF